MKSANATAPAPTSASTEIAIAIPARERGSPAELIETFAADTLCAEAALSPGVTPESIKVGAKFGPEPEPGYLWSPDSAGARGTASPTAARSVSMNSCVDAQRATGSRAQTRSNQPSSAGGTLTNPPILGRGSVQILSKMSPKDSPLNATLPVSIV